MADYTGIIAGERDGVALRRRNRPEKLNSMGGAMMAQFIDYGGPLSSGEYGVRAVVLTGEGRGF